MFETLNSLDPRRQGPVYFNLEDLIRFSRQPTGEPKQWLDKAGEIDQCARVLISHCIEMAADPLLASAQGWIDLAAKVQSTERTDIDVILALRAIGGADESLLDDKSPKGPTKTVIQLLEKKLHTLERFRNSALELESEWRQQLAELQRPLSRLGKTQRKRSKKNAT